MLKYLVLCSVLALSAYSQNAPQLKLSTLSAGYIPDGFDSNDEVQLVVEGVYSNTCSKPAGTRFTVQAATKTIQLSTYEYKYSGPCLDVLVPHDEVVSLGIVSEGSYQVVQSNGIPLGRLTVKAATKNTPDDYLYAPISQAYVRNQNGQVALTLSGTFTNSCMRLQKVISNVQGNVVTVQPIANLLAAGACTPGQFPFEQTVALSQARPGRYLLHVRSLNGKSINNLFDLR